MNKEEVKEEVEAGAEQMEEKENVVKMDLDIGELYEELNKIKDSLGKMEDVLIRYIDDNTGVPED